MSTSTSPQPISGTVRRTRHPRPIAIDISNAERVFLFNGLNNIGRSVECVLHHPGMDHMASPWQRDQVRQHVLLLRRQLSSGALTLLVTTPIQKTVLQYAIEANTYFENMPDGDYRLTLAQFRQADELRKRVAKLIGRHIRPVPLGGGRGRIEGKEV